MSKEFKLTKNKTITKELIPDKFERRYEKNVDIVPKKENKLIAIIFRENKSAKIRYIAGNIKDFIVSGHLYFTEPTAIYNCDNGQRIALYLESISTPLSHANVEKVLDKVKYKDIDGTEKEKVITRIKGLKYDSRIIEIFTDRKFAEIFTRVQIDKWAFYTFICLIVLIALSVTGIIISYFYR